MFFSPHRRSKAIDSITLLIHLVVAIFFLDLTFLVNHHVESLGNSVGCKIMAAVMHYFLLATFMWFATQAFHLCLQLTVAGQVNIRHYVLRVSLGSWGECTSLSSFVCPDWLNDVTDAECALIISRSATCGRGCLAQRWEIWCTRH